MLPVLLDLKFVKIYTFGVFLVLALLWAMFILWRNIKLTSYKEEDMFDLFFASIIGSLFFSRLIFVLCNFSKFGFDILKFILINGYPGLSLIGALFGGLGVFLVFIHIKKIAFKDLADYFIPSLCIAFAVSKIGSFIAGVDVGTKTKFPLNVWYVGYSGGRHIVAAYESLLFFILTYITYRILLHMRRTSVPPGFGFVFFVFFFSLFNLLLDNLKQNHLYFAGFNVNFWTSFVLFIISSGFAMMHYRTYLREVFTNSKLHIHANYFKKFTRRAQKKTDS